ncbi:hypothetical protein EYF80_060374 [Liparis tanakae]|uniref:Uncharacterized protein n=1 Tax=Liparis tanakae TaxID=230148 RepID=A0A4Z2EKK2_9TELE|nr:hypothetical protein EYF80_060374 [Liparis tanakae]
MYNVDGEGEKRERNAIIELEGRRPLPE